MPWSVVMLYTKHPNHQEKCFRYTGHKVSVGLRYITARKEGNLERVRGCKTSYVLSLPLPPRTSPGRIPTRVFVQVNEAQRYIVTSIHHSKEKIILEVIPISQGIIHCDFVREKCNINKTRNTYNLHHLKRAIDDEYLTLWNLRTNCYTVTTHLRISLTL